MTSTAIEPKTTGTEVSTDYDIGTEAEELLKRISGMGEGFASLSILTALKRAYNQGEIIQIRKRLKGLNTRATE